jgi:hypothetical protein
LLETNLPSTAEATVTQQNGRRIVHVLHYPAVRRAPDLDIVEEAIPLANVRISLRMEKRPLRVYLAPQRQSMKFDFSNGYAEVAIPSIQGHQMVVFED